MANRTYYHNVTSGLVNESDEEDFILDHSEGDIVYKSHSGNSQIYIVTYIELEELREEFIY